MKLSISIAEYAKHGLGGAVNAMNLGITQITAAGLPIEFRGAVVLLVEPEKTDPAGKRDFTLTAESPSHKSVQFGHGEFTIVVEPRSQIILCKSIVMPITAAGSYVFRFSSVDAHGETHLHVSVDEAPQETQGTKP